MSIGQLRATITATEQFLASRTSTKRGIRQVRKSQIAGIRRSLSLEGEEPLTFEEAESLQSMFEDQDFLDVTRLIPASDIWTAMGETSSNRDGLDGFISRLEQIVTVSQDNQLVEQATKIYNKYVK